MQAAAYGSKKEMPPLLSDIKQVVKHLLVNAAE
jgi:hypothetical protein